jgi:hypothetical protein
MPSDSSVVGRFRTRHPLDRALAEAARILGQALLHGVGEKGRSHRSATGQQAQHEAQATAAHHRLPGRTPVGHGGPQAANLLGQHRVLGDGLAVHQDLGHPEQADHHRQDFDAAGQVHGAQGEPLRPVDDVHADDRAQEPQRHHQHAFDF